MAAIFDIPRTETSDSIPTSLSVLPDPENIGLAVGLSMVFVSKLRYKRIWSLEATIMDFPLPVSSRLVVQHCYYFGWLDPEKQV